MLEKRIFGLARVFFVSTLGILLIVIFYWQLASWAIRREKTIKVIGSGSSQTRLDVSEDSKGDRRIRGEAIAADARREVVRRYLSKYRSVLLPYTDLIVDLSDTYGYQYYWIVAIAQQESNLCKKVPEGSNNCWGYGVHSRGILKFENLETAIRSFAEYLDREYFEKGLETSEKIMKKYCPSSDGSWAYGVNKFIGELESGVPGM